jgi:hypothetical protein
MWPFNCIECPRKDVEKEIKDHLIKEANSIIYSLRELSNLEWTSLREWTTKRPPLNTNLLVSNEDFTYFGFLYYDDGWDYSRKINMHGKGQIWATYTNPESIHWWLNLDLIKKG